VPDTFITFHCDRIYVTAQKTVALQRATDNDAPWLADICARAFSGYLEKGSYVPGGLSRVDSPRSHLKFMEYFDYYRITLGNSTAGGLMVAPRGPGHVEVVNVYVDPDYRRRGVASAAFSAVESLYADVSLWTIGMPEWDDAAAGLVQKAGYVHVGRTVEDDGTPLRWFNKLLEPITLTRIGSLREGMRNMHVEGSVQEKAPARAVRGRRPGETLSVTEVGLVDETGRVVLTLWNSQIKLVQVGDRLRVENGYVGGYRGITQLSAGKTGRIVKLG
jgi:ribosomal protein S18 acetylase RimI-like enzyme